MRVDSATARVVVRDTAGVERTDGCPLDAAFGGTSVTCGETEATVNGGYDVDIDLGTAAEVERVQVPAFKHFEGSVSENNIAFRVAYAAGIGRVSEEPGTPFGGTGLVRATIRGTTYGPSVTADPSDPAAYFPLAVGNAWETEKGEDGFLERNRRAVLRDTLIDGTRYTVVEEAMAVIVASQDPEGWGSVQTRLLRYDTLSTRVVTRLANGTERAVTCPLGAAFGDVIGCAGQTDYLIPAGVVAGVAEESEVQVGEERVTIAARKQYRALNTLQGQVLTGGFGAGIGPLPQPGSAFCASCDERFTYLRLVDADGAVREYGTRYAVADAPAREAARLAVRAFPSPASGPLTVAVAVPEAARVTVEVVDAFGRHVWRAEADAAPGETRLRVEAGAWAPGLYVVCVWAGSEAATTTIVRR